MKNSYKKFLMVFTMVLTMSSLTLRAQILYEGFEDFSAAITAGWSSSNLSSPIGTNVWAQGTTGLGILAASGSDFSFAETNYTCIAAGSAGTISNWLISPTVTVTNGDSVLFYTGAYNSTTYPDRLECRLSTAGASVNVGASATTVGDFTTILVSVNPNLDNTSFPNLIFQQFYGVVSGLNGPTLCRVAFRYFVTDGGELGANSSTIGLDEVVVKSGTVGIQNLSNEASIKFYPNPVKDVMHINSSVKINHVKISDLLGQVVENVAVDANEVQLNTTNLEGGVYFAIIETVKGTSVKKITITK